MPLRTPYERWQDGLDKAIQDRKWSAYDCEVKSAVNEFNLYLGSTTGYRPLDWKLIKAMLWTETGASNPEWKTKPMQIGVPGDPGLMALLSGKEGGALIMPPTWQTRLTVSSVSTVPSHNIHAGIAYMLMRMAYFENRMVVMLEAPAVYDAIVHVGDSIEKIAKEHGTTPDLLKAMNNGISALKPGQILKYRKGSVQKVIAGWRPIIPQTIAQRYNGGGDPYYAKKLDYALGLIRKGKAVLCER